MKFCSTCLSFCPPPPPISAKNEAEGLVVSGELVFVQQDSLTQSDVKSDTLQILDNSPEKRLVFVNTAEISPQKNSELFQRPVPTNQLVEFQSPISNQEVKPQFQGMQAQAPGAQELFQSPIPIKEAPGQVQSTSSNLEVTIFNGARSVWDINPSNSATPLTYEQSKEPSPPPQKIFFGAGFMPIRRRDGVPSSIDGVEISQSPSQIDKSIQNESRCPSPTPSPQASSGGDNVVRYLLA